MNGQAHQQLLTAVAQFPAEPERDRRLAAWFAGVEPPAPIACEARSAEAVKRSERLRRAAGAQPRRRAAPPAPTSRPPRRRFAVAATVLVVLLVPILSPAIGLKVLSLLSSSRESAEVGWPTGAGEGKREVAPARSLQRVPDTAVLAPISQENTPADLEPGLDRQDAMPSVPPIPRAADADAVRASSIEALPLWVQVGTFLSRDPAENLAFRLARVDAGSMRDLKLRIVARTDSSKTVYLSQFGPFESRSDAERFCARLLARATGGDCVIALPDERGEATELAIEPPPEKLLDLRSPPDAKQLQQRLNELGGFRLTVDGMFGPKSRAALKKTKSACGLPADDVWDVETQRALMAARCQRSGEVAGGS